MRRIFQLSILAMSFTLVTTFLALLVIVHIGADSAAPDDVGFIYEGFRSSNLSLDGIAKITDNGLLRITNITKLQMGHAFYPDPINFKSTSTAQHSLFPPNLCLQ